MTLWIDADACPGAVRDIVLKAAYRLTLTTVFVANKPLSLPEEPFISQVRVGAGADVADDYIVAHAAPGDLVVSEDVPLAARLVDVGVVVMSPRGVLLGAHNIGERLAARDTATALRDFGMMTGGGPKPFGEKEKRLFANTFDQMLTKLLRVAG